MKAKCTKCDTEEEIKPIQGLMPVKLPGWVQVSYWATQEKHFLLCPPCATPILAILP